MGDQKSSMPKCERLMEGRKYANSKKGVDKKAGTPEGKEGGENLKK